MNLQKVFLVYDLGGTFVKWGLFDENLKVIFNDKIPTFSNKRIGSEIIKDLANHAKNLLKKYKILAIGMSSPGAIDSNNGIVLGAAPNIREYQGVKIKEIFQKIIKVPFFVGNDVNCATFGEFTFSKINKYKNIMMITLGTGIGGGIIIDGKLQFGKHNFTGEIGHMPYKGKIWENFASTKALTSKVSKYLQREISGEEVLKIVKTNKNVEKIFLEWLDNVGYGLAIIFMILDPDVLIIGGGISEGYSFDSMSFWDNHIKKFLDPNIKIKMKIFNASLGNKAALYGAAILARKLL